MNNKILTMGGVFVMSALISILPVKGNIQAEPLSQSATAVTTTITPSPKPELKYGLYKEGDDYHYYYKGKKQRNCWKKVDGRRYYFKDNGDAVVCGHRLINGKYYVFNKKGQLLAPKNNALMTVGNYKYYVTPQGTAIKGWHIIKGKLYYVYKSGKCAAGKTVSGISLTADGSAKNTTKTQCKIATMNFISSHTSPGMSKSQKFRTCFNYIIAYTNFAPNINPSQAEFKSGNWVYSSALNMFNSYLTGSCYGISSAIASIAKELGYQPYVIAAAEDHSFVMIDGRYYDNMGPLFGATSHFAYTLAYKVKF